MEYKKKKNILNQHQIPQVVDRNICIILLASKRKRKQASEANPKNRQTLTLTLSSEQ